MNGSKKGRELKEAYTDFAYLYDELMDNIPYEDWCDYIVSLFNEYDISDGLICELGCGTGTMTMLLSDSGYDMIGIDCSEDMLEAAREKLYEAMDEAEDAPSILYLNQDMRSFELYGTVRAFVSVCDSMNYLLTENDFLSVLRLVNNYLEKDGLFIFDLKTPYFYKNIAGNHTRSDVRDDCAMIWENYYDEEKKNNSYALTLFLEEEDGHYTRSEEYHEQHAFEIEEVKELIQRSGMELLRVYDAFTHDEPNEKSERIYFIVKESFQKGKTYC